MSIYVNLLALCLFVIQTNGQYEGETCVKDGIMGVCTNVRKCQSAVDDIRNRRGPPKLCSFSNTDPIVCCLDVIPTTTRRAPVRTTKRITTSTTTEYVPEEEIFVLNDKENQSDDQCERISSNLTAPKTGQKAWDKCVEYQHKLIFPCGRGVILTGGLSRGKKCKHEANQLVVGGINATKDEFPHMVLLGYGTNINNLLWLCGGSLISERFILTAAHCTPGRNMYYIHAWATNLSIAATSHVEFPTMITIVDRLIPNSFEDRYNNKSLPKQKTYCYLFHIKYVSMETVVAVLHNSNGDTIFSLIAKPGPVTYARVGALRRTDQLSPSQLYAISEIIKHPQYHSPQQYYDIALLKTDRDVILDEFTVPACLDVGAPGDYSRVLATGWGAKQNRGANEDRLQKVILNKFTTPECAENFPPGRYLKQGYNVKTQICYGDKDKSKDTCQGDSGGPIQLKSQKLHCMYTVIGVTSFGRACGQIGKPGIYTRVAEFVPWIESIVWP